MSADNPVEIMSADIAGLARLVEYYDGKSQNELAGYITHARKTRDEILPVMLDLAKAKTAYLKSLVENPETVPAEIIAEAVGFGECVIDEDGGQDNDDAGNGDIG